MKTILGIVAAVLIVGAGVWYYMQPEAPAVRGNEHTPAAEVPEVSPVMHATMVLEWGDTVIYTDPTGDTETFKGRPSPDLILVTDIHGDHLSTSTLSAVVASSTRIIAPQAVADLLPETLESQTTVLDNGEEITVNGFDILAVPMYNLPESEESRHVKGRGNGYVLEREGYRVYIAGDTAGTPEMRTLEDIDMAFVPMNMPFTMPVEEAADAVLDFKPRIVYPFHYRGQDGLSDVNKFKQLVNEGDPDIDVRLLDWYPAN